MDRVGKAAQRLCVGGCEPRVLVVGACTRVGSSLVFWLRRSDLRDLVVWLKGVGATRLDVVKEEHRLDRARGKRAAKALVERCFRLAALCRVDRAAFGCT